MINDTNHIYTNLKRYYKPDKNRGRLQFNYYNNDCVAQAKEPYFSLVFLSISTARLQLGVESISNLL